MCRWLAYNGPAIPLDALVFKPRNSLIQQSLHALEGASPTNGDGFGVGWYDARPEPGVFRDILPAWNDENLRSLAEQVRSRLFFAHVRASTGTPTARTNCHPFRHGRWLFMHNGSIGGFERVRRALAMAIAPDLFPCLRGNTDSETFFYLLLTNGAEGDPPAAFARAVGQVLAAMERAGVGEPFKMTSALTDGETIYALRYSSGAPSPSLYYACGPEVAGVGEGKALDPCNAILVLSEPLDSAQSQWVAVPESHLLMAGDGAIGVAAFAPVR
jgi:glutamine amidotransferase